MSHIQEYNEVSDDMREDEETKMELHQRVDDLREQLWSICDERKDQAEKERETVMNDGWLDDRLGVLSNFYITIMQAEVDRFQDTVRVMKDYYRGMEGEIPDELNSNYIRLPLIEVRHLTFSFRFFILMLQQSIYFIRLVVTKTNYWNRSILLTL